MKKTMLAVVALSVLMLASLPSTKRTSAATRSNLQISWYADPNTAFLALINDDIDILDLALSAAQKAAVEANPNLQIGQYDDMGMMEFDLNNNDTIASYPAATNPCYFADFRRALAHMIDKEYIITNILQDSGRRLDAPVSYPQYPGWVDPTVVTYDWNGDGIIDPSEDNYPFPPNVVAAVGYLADLGFNDTDGNGYLNYPNRPEWGDAAGDDTTTMPLRIIIRGDHAHRAAAGRYLYHQLEGDPAIAADSILAQSLEWTRRNLVGGDLDTTDELHVSGPMDWLLIYERNYHIYTGGWSLNRFPTYLFYLFHSMFWYPGGSNYATALAHPYEDMILEKLYYATNVADAQNASKWYTHEHILNVKNIPLWSYSSYVAWRKELAGVVNMKGCGVVNDWTFLNAWRVGTSNPLRLGCVGSWDTLNILYSSWQQEYVLLDRVYTSMMAVNPYDLSSDIPWAARDWEVGTWHDNRTNTYKQAVTYYIDPGPNRPVGCASPATGSYAGRFNATDYVFTIWYNYAYDDSWQWYNFMDIHHTEKIDDYTVRVCFDDMSMWFVYGPIYPLLGPSTILEPQLCAPGHATFTGADLIQGPPGYFEYAFTTDEVVSVTSATRNGALITEGVDFYIRTGYDVFAHNIFVNKTTFEPTDIIVINYNYAIPNGAGGTYLGGNLGYDWTDTTYTYGSHYPVSMTAIGATLNKNPYFLLPTIPKGEIDFRWNWMIGPQPPRSGYFKIDVLDVVKCTGSYCTRGDGAFSPVYNPGADLDDTDLCHIGILDLIVVTGKYGTAWGQPP